MTARVRCRACGEPIALVTAKVLEWPRTAAGLIDHAAERHALGCGVAALEDIRRVWAA